MERCGFYSHFNHICCLHYDEYCQLSDGGISTSQGYEDNKMLTFIKCYHMACVPISSSKSFPLSRSSQQQRDSQQLLLFPGQQFNLILRLIRACRVALNVLEIGPDVWICVQKRFTHHHQACQVRINLQFAGERNVAARVNPLSRPFSSFRDPSWQCPTQVTEAGSIPASLPLSSGLPLCCCSFCSVLRKSFSSCQLFSGLAHHFLLSETRMQTTFPCRLRSYSVPQGQPSTRHSAADDSTLTITLHCL